jgi:ABC-type glycerol-3-phosphate transport system permease component
MAEERERIMNKNFSKAILFCFMLFASLVSVYPLIWVILQSFKTESEFLQSIWNFPKAIRFDSYGIILFRQGLARYFKNSAIVTFSTTIFDLTLITMAGYAFSKLRFRFKGFYYNYIILNLLIPTPIIILPMFLQVNRLGLINTLPALVLPYFQGFAPLGLILSRSYFGDIPDELVEASKLDGCGPFGIFLRIMIPLAKPIIATMAILASMAAWNEYLWALISITEKRRYTVSIGIAALNDTSASIGYIPVFAGLSLSAMVIVIIFLCMQKNFIRSIAAGAVKG